MTFAVVARDQEPEQIGAELNPPVAFGRYQLVRRLGYGGYATVFLGLEVSASGTTREVVVKRLHEHLSTEDRARQAFLDEARMTIGLEHPNIVKAIDFGTAEGRPFLAMEYLVGADLDLVLNRLRTQSERLRPELALQIACDALAGLAHLHSQTDANGNPCPIVHRDISPHNLFVTADGTTKLLDFGIAKGRSRVVQTTTGVIKGKFGYMAPEQARAEDITPRTDVWAIGVVFWEMLSGQRLFDASNAFSTLATTMMAKIPDLDEHFGVPTPIAQVVQRALAREPEARFDNAQEMLRDLLASAPYSPGPREEVAKLVEGLFAPSLERARELSQRRRITPHSPSEQPLPRWLWAGAGAAGLASLLALGGQLVRSAPMPRESEAQADAGMQQRPRPGEQVTAATETSARERPADLSGAAAPVPADADSTPAGALGPNDAPQPTPPITLSPSAQQLPVATRKKPPQRTGSSQVERAADLAPGQLTLVSEPWSAVTLGGKPLGTTPLVNITLPAGQHELRLTHSSFSTPRVLVVTIEPGRSLSRRVLLQDLAGPAGDAKAPTTHGRPRP